MEAQLTSASKAVLSDADREIYSWQLPVAGFGEQGQQKLKAASVLISRCGGLGGVVAFELAAAGVGRLILAHGGRIKASDLNRQLLMTRNRIGDARVECAASRLREFNPDLEILAVPENANASNAERLVGEADLIIDSAPLFEERYLLNREAVRQRKPLVEAAVYELEARITTVLPGKTPCLRCLYPEPPPTWTRRFPVFGAVSGAVGCLAAMEAIKLLAGFGEPLLGVMITCDLRNMFFRRLRVRRDPQCPECASIQSTAPL